MSDRSNLVVVLLVGGLAVLSLCGLVLLLALRVDPPPALWLVLSSSVSAILVLIRPPAGPPPGK